MIKYVKRENKRYKLIKVLKMQKTIRCKLLAIIGWLKNVNYEIPDYEIEARMKSKNR